MPTERPHGTIAAPQATAVSLPFDFQAWLETWQNELLFFRVDVQECIDYVSPSVREILGFEPADLLGRPVREFFDPDHALCDQLREMSTRVLAHDAPESRSCVAQHRQGQYVFFLLRDRKVFDRQGEYVGCETMAQEVTRRVEAELWLRQSERKYRRLLEQFRGDYIIYTRDSQGLITYVSPSVEALLGYHRHEVVGRNWQDVLVIPADAPEPVPQIRGAQDAANPVTVVVVELQRRDGERRVFEVQEWATFGVDGSCLAMEGIAKDITDSQHAEAEVRRLKDDLERRVALRTEELSRTNEDLRASEARYRDVVDTQAEFIVRWTPDGRRTFVNEPYCRFLGRPMAEVIGSTLMPTIHPDDMHLVDEFLAKLTPEELTPEDSPSAVRLLSADGTYRWTQWTSQVYFDEAGQPIEFQSVGRDVTELKMAEDLLRQKEAHLAHLSRLATMGEMVAGIAHELSQPLHAAKTFAEASRRHLEGGRPGSLTSAIECSREISGAIVRTVEIIRRLREFTKSRPVNREELDLNDVVAGAVKMMAYETRSARARVRLELADGLAPIEGDRIQLEQVCVNLLKNACEALVGVPAGRRRLQVTTSQCDGRVRLAIKDTGVGLAGADATRIFDAFYSTKPEGMGMGLSLCKSIAEAHHMHIEFSANSDQPGMTFHVSLPAKAPAPP